MILLIYPKHSPFPHSISAPLSIFCLGSYIEEKGGEAEYFDERVQGWDHLMQMLDKKPLLVGISTMTSYQIRRAVAIASFIRRYYPELPLVWGGVHPTMCSIQTAESELVDFIIKGEGEAALYDLANVLSSSHPSAFFSIDNLVWKKNGSIKENKNRKFLDLNSLPFAYSGRAAGMLKIYFKINRGREGVAMETSRGCNFSCRFCYNQFFNQSICRAKNKDKLEKELCQLHKMGIKDILFVDDNLGVSRQHIKDLCDITRRYNMKWSGGLRADMIDKELVNILENGVCKSLFFGIESINPAAMKYINKSISVEKIREVIKYMAGSSIVPVYSFMTGFPQEDSSDLNEQLDFIDRINIADPRAEIAVQPYNPLPGTLLYEDALRQGFSPPKKLEGWWRMTTGEILGPWVKNRAVLKNLYLISFLAFRGSRFLNNIIFFPFCILAGLRWKFKFFKLYTERIFYILLIRIWILRDELFINWFLLKRGFRICHRLAP